MSSSLFDSILNEIANELTESGTPFNIQEEYSFASRIHNRRFRSDYAELHYGILFEYEGLQTKHNRSRHTTTEGFTRDCTKYNMGTGMGFSWLRYTRNHLDKDKIKQDIISTMEVKQLFSAIGENCVNCNKVVLMPKRILLDNMCLLCELTNKNNKKKAKSKTLGEGLKQKRISDDLEVLLRASVSASSPSISHKHRQESPQQDLPPSPSQ